MAIFPDARTMPPVPMPVPRQTRGARTWRFVTGAPLDGYARTDATFLRPATRVLTPTGHAARWHHMPGWKRAAWRIGTVTGPVAEGYGLLTAPLLTEVSDGLGAAGAVAYGTYRTYRRVQSWKHTRTYVRPLHSALGPMLGIPVSLTRAESYLTIPVEFRSPDAEVRVTLPEGFNAPAEIRKEIVRTVTEKLGLSDIDHAFHMIGARPFLTLKAAPTPPGKVLAKDVMHLVMACAESAPLIGLGTRGQVISVDLDADSPHVIASMASGAGKSVLLRGLLAQGLHNGAYGFILDRKRVSHSWAKGLPNVTYCRDIADIHYGLVSLGAEVTRRYEILDDDENADVGPRVLILVEEMNATMTKLKRFWAEIREKDDPKTSPALDALGEILFMGRQGKMHVLCVAQLATANAVGGPEFRENFSTRVLGRYTRNAWYMLVPEVSPMPKSSRHRGRVQVVLAGTAHETQVAFWQDAEARDWASCGTVTTDITGSDVPASQVSHPAPTLGMDGSQVLGRPTLHVVPDPAEAEPEDTRVTLSEAVSEGIVAVSLASLRKASTRDGEFPRPGGKRGSANLYERDQLMRWERNRERAPETADAGA